MALCLLLAASLSLIPQGSVSIGPPGRRPNVVLIVIDDVGQDLVGAYGRAPVAAPCTPHLDALASRGLLFRNTWTNPTCTPSRAQILTGRHAFRTGVGTLVGAAEQPGLPIDIETLPRALGAAGYDTAALGKWHLARPLPAAGQGLMHPLNIGFRTFAGSMFNLGRGPISGAPAPGCTGGSFIFNYTRWIKNTDGVQSCTHTFPTVDTTDDAIRALSELQPPWFLYFSTNAVHLPGPVVPAALCQSSACPDPPHVCPAGGMPIVQRVKQNMQALDSELGRFLDWLAAVDPNAYVFVIGDNGTASAVSEGHSGGCFDPGRAKGTLYQAGVGVPLIVTGPDIKPGETKALVSSTDLFATIAELCGVRAATPDSRSFTSVLRGQREQVRSELFAERFGPNGPPVAPAFHFRTLRDERWKLIQRMTANDPRTLQEELFDLGTDPCESFDRIPQLRSDPEAASAYAGLVQRLEAYR